MRERKLKARKRITRVSLAFPSRRSHNGNLIFQTLREKTAGAQSTAIEKSGDRTTSDFVGTLKIDCDRTRTDDKPK